MKIKTLLLLIIFIYVGNSDALNLSVTRKFNDIGGDLGKYNIILNSSFEIWLDSLGIQMPLGWLTSEAQDSGSAIRTTNAHSGVYALQLNGSDTSAYATTVALCQANHNYYFSAWCQTSSWVAGSFIISWFKITQQPAGNPTIIPIIRSTNYYNYSQMLQSPDSAILVNVNIVTLPYTTIYVDDVTLSDTILSGLEERAEYYSKQTRPLKFYPNPGQTNIEIISEKHIDCLALYDISGKIVTEIFKPPPKFSLNISHLPNGIYFIKSQVNNAISVFKFIKQN
ncbi:MAG: T9SS type A sorting domain-containing protein [candidate division WOR-3 bacterium]